MPFYEIIGILRDFLAHNFTKYQYFSISDQVYSFRTIKLHIPCLFQLNVDFMAQKMHKSAISQRSVSSFYQIKFHTLHFSIFPL